MVSWLKRRMTGMDCDEFFESVSEYYDNSLPDSQKELFEKHFSKCNSCLNFFEGFIKSEQLIAGPVKSSYLELIAPDDIDVKIKDYLREKKLID